jgi:uncharacterized protein (TIGR03000 family)
MSGGRSSLLCLVALLLSASPGLAQRYTPPPPPASATIEVRQPADAELWFDGNATTQEGDRRIFTTPLLRPGRRYEYDVMARWRVGGQDVVQREQLVVRAGEVVTLQFPHPTRREAGLDHVSIQEIMPIATVPASRQPGPRRLPGHMSIVEFDEPRH